MSLYHYCPNRAFLSIVTERKIRLTDLSHSNDLLEGKWVRNIISEICGENDVSIKNTKKILERFDVLARILTAGAFCLSRKEDLLSQWISYANKARGVSIGFNEKYLEKLVNSQPLEHFRLGLENVIYEHKIQKELITPGVKEIIKFVNDGALNQGRFGLLTPQEDLVKKYEAANERLIETVIDFLPFLYQIKNPAFSEEKEERLVSIIFKNPESASSVSYAQFADRGDHIVSFLDVPLPDLGVPIFDEVILGPKNTSSEPTIKGFLKKFGFKDVKISKSKAPLR